MSGLPGLQTVGLLGGGVIGGAWAARFALNGVDVKLYDIDPEATRKMNEIMANARRAYRKLTLAPLPTEGTITFVSSPEEAVTGVDFVQESAPERLELKQELLARASKAAAPNTVFGSSTSGLLPTQIQKDMVNPERFVVGHPFNPVYLMPLVEICGGDLTSQATKERAREVYTQIGMRPLMLSKEIDGFVADRLMEALWREALWMVNDGIATAEEIDDAMRFGPGLRWSFMGTFLVYRIAGGEAGMRHFMAQFGPSLKWPWTKLMDVPELDDVLLEKIVRKATTRLAPQPSANLKRCATIASSRCSKDCETKTTEPGKCWPITRNCCSAVAQCRCSTPKHLQCRTRCLFLRNGPTTTATPTTLGTRSLQAKPVIPFSEPLGSRPNTWQLGELSTP